MACVAVDRVGGDDRGEGLEEDAHSGLVISHIADGMSFFLSSVGIAAGRAELMAQSPGGPRLAANPSGAGTKVGFDSVELTPEALHLFDLVPPQALAPLELGSQVPRRSGGVVGECRADKHGNGEGEDGEHDLRCREAGLFTERAH